MKSSSTSLYFFFIARSTKLNFGVNLVGSTCVEANMIENVDEEVIEFTTVMLIRSKFGGQLSLNNGGLIFDRIVMYILTKGYFF